MRITRGLGVYPPEACQTGDSVSDQVLNFVLGSPCESAHCFDRDRPSWMPYWMDTAAENACKAGLYPGARHGTIPTPPAPHLPAPPDGRGADWTPQQVDAAMWRGYVEDVNAAIAAAIANGTYVPGGTDAGRSNSLGRVAVVGLAVAAAVVVWPMIQGKGRRRR